nr:unnamed protein product [Callosobruchus chinensis]
MLVTSRYTKFIELLQKCPFEVLEAAGHFFLSYPQLNAHLLKDLPPVSVDELYGCGVIDRRGKLSPLKKDGVNPRLIPDIQTQMGNIVQRLMVKIQTYVNE